MSVDAPITQVMSKAFFSIGTSVAVGRAAEFARDKGIHHMPVTEAGRVVGLVCTCDLHEAPPASPVAQWMSMPVVALEVGGTVRAAAELMNVHGVGSVVVMEGGAACGIVTRLDLLELGPDVAALLQRQRCEACGLPRHLSAGADGRTLCLYCRQPAIDLKSAQVDGPSETELADGGSPSLDSHPLASLIAEHQLVLSVSRALSTFSDFIRAEGGSVGRTDLQAFMRVFRDLADYVHHEKEEHILLPVLAKHGFDWNSGPVADARREHRQERYLISELSQFAMQEHRWDRNDRRRVVSTARELAQFQAEHIERENELLFAPVTERMELAQQQSLSAQLHRFDQKVRTYLPCAELKGLAQALVLRYRDEGQHGVVAAAV